MKFKNLCLFLFILVSMSCFSQGEANIWYFGNNAGLDFNSGAPVVLHDGELVTDEGCAVISTAFGELLFYTDGITVYNKNHQIMANGTGLAGNPSSTQSALILPMPGSSTIYYVFTVTAFGGGGGMKYSIVDMDLNGGLGDVTDMKNVSIQSPVCEKLTAVRKKNEAGFWIIGHGFTGLFSDTGGNFYSYSLTSAGLNMTPVVSTTGTVINGLLYRTMGYLKVSPNGKKMVSANYGLITEVFDFDRITGVVSNGQKLSNNPNGYGVEFSISGDFAYLTTGATSINELHQYDLNSSDIPNSVKKIYTAPEGMEIYGLQIASDFKIYVAMSGTSYLSVINNPDILAPGCNFVTNAIDLSPATVELGLPQFNQSYFFGSIFAENVCFGDTTIFTFESDIDATSVLWDFGDGTTSPDVAPSHVYTSPGTYNVIVTAESEDGTISKSREIIIYQPPSFSAPLADVKLCGEAGDVIDLNQFNAYFFGSFSQSEYGIKYYETLEGAELNTLSLSTDFEMGLGTNKVFVKFYVLENEECAVYSDFNIVLYKNPVANPIRDVYKCDDVSNNSVETFSLFDNNTQIIGGQNQNNFSVSYHLNQNDANLGDNDLDANFPNTTNPQEIFARIYNTLNEDCYATTSFFITVSQMPIINQPSDLYSCFDDNGTATFDLSSLDSEVLGLQSATDFAVTYHANSQDAIEGANSLSSSYDSTFSTETIFARLSNVTNKDCFDIASFKIFAKAKPALVMKDVYVICEGQQFVTVSVSDHFSTYLWSNGATTSETTFDTAGPYTLIVTIDYGDVICSTIKNFTVRNSGPAEIKDVITRDLNVQNNSVVVEVQGIGQYEYSLDGINYQGSSTFNYLTGGKYTVYVKDIFGCGIVDEDFFIMVYPRFFTPNGDGYNDVWKINFSDLQEPGMQIHIFDRYGRLIKRMLGAEDGWDGTLNGNVLPSTDYWFTLTRENGSVLKGHFSLKR